ncbi:MAG TPA: glycosyltransferase, partial [Flavobacteriales bacterium]|nr:glycosyltransferase [Flavobacteriales bacterium]
AKAEREPLKTTEIIITHVGLLGESQPVEPFLKALNEIAVQHPALKDKLVLRIIGGVSEIILDSINQHASWLKVQQLGYVKHAEAIYNMVNAHILLNSLPITGKQEYMISGKLMEYIASGRPVLALGNTASDAAEMLKAYTWCKVFEREDVPGIKTWLKELLEQLQKGNTCGHETGQLVFSRQKTTVALAELLRQV